MRNVSNAESVEEKLKAIQTPKEDSAYFKLCIKMCILPSIGCH